MLIALSLSALSLSACDSGGTGVVVDLKTDYVPGRQFFGVRTELGDPELSSISEREDTFVDATGDYLSGERVAELSALTPGSVAVRVSLLDASGETIATRTTIMTLSGQHALTVLITSSCEGVSCPGASDDPSFSACVGGRCVDPRCSPQNPELCGDPQCASDAQCSSPVPCADALCVEGACFVRVQDSRCGASEQCHPREGCVLADDVDAGPGCPSVETECDDGVDDDCDGQTDCADDDCADVACDDASACTENDACTAGACSGTPVSCDDDNACTDDACDPASGCSNTDNTASCDDGSVCTEGDVCSEGTCAGAAVVCDDGNPCTDDACDPASGCTITDNTASCDNGFWCDGPDVCSGGMCVAAGPSPCPAFCNEMGMVCEECVGDSDCGSVSYGTYGTCGGFTSTCDETGTQSRSVMTPRCSSGMCTVVTSSESRSCTRDTDGTGCGTVTYGTYGTCGGYASTCDETGTQSRSVMTPTCSSGSCSTVTTSQSRSCSRDTDGNSCGTTTYTAWSTCGGFSNACDTTGTQTRTRTERRCVTGGCANQNFGESRSCTRSVANGTSCGGTWLRCCGGTCRDLRTNAYCGGCAVNCNAVGLTCASTGTGGYACRGCSSNSQCTSILNSSATCYNVSSPPAWCQCQCGGTTVCANGGCGTNMFCHSCPGTNFCAPFGGSC